MSKHSENTEKSAVKLVLENTLVFRCKQTHVFCKKSDKEMAEENKQNSLCFADYDAIGFDIDHTLAKYNNPNVFNVRECLLMCEKNVADVSDNTTFYPPLHLHLGMTQEGYDSTFSIFIFGQKPCLSWSMAKLVSVHFYLYGLPVRSLREASRLVNPR